MDDPLRRPETLQAVTWLRKTLQTGYVKGFDMGRLGGHGSGDYVVTKNVRDPFADHATQHTGDYTLKLVEEVAETGWYDDGHNRRIIEKTIAMYEATLSSQEGVEGVETTSRGLREGVVDREREEEEAAEMHRIEMATARAKVEFATASGKLALRATRAVVSIKRIASEGSEPAQLMLAQVQPLCRPVALLEVADD